MKSFWMKIVVWASLFSWAPASFAGKAQALSIGIGGEFESLNPLLARLESSSYIMGFVSRSLLGYDPEKGYFPDLLSSLPEVQTEQVKSVVVNGMLMTEVSCAIRADAKWGDGVDITGHDLAFTKQVASSSNVLSVDKAVFQGVDIIVDSGDVRKFKLIVAPSNQQHYLDILVKIKLLPRHLDGPIFSKYVKRVEGYDRHSLYVQSPLNKGLYNGPYFVSEFLRGESLTLVENPLFWGEKPKIKTIKIHLVNNFSVFSERMKNQNLDIVVNLERGLQQELREKSIDVNHRWIKTSSRVFEHIVLNLRHPILKDVRVRRALSFSLDRSLLGQAAAYPTIFSLPPLDTWIFNHYPKPQQFMKQAAQLLDEADWKLGAGGWRWKRGKKLTLQLMTNKNHSVRVRLLQRIKSQWRDLGVEVSLVKVGAQEFFSEHISKGKVPCMALYARRNDIHSIKMQMHPNSIPTLSNGFQGENIGGWSNPRVRDLIDMSDRSPSIVSRNHLIQEIYKIYTYEVPVIPLYFRAHWTLVSTRLKNYHTTGFKYYESHFASQWHF